MKPEHKRNTCLACGGRLPKEPVMSFSGMPASAQHIPKREELGSDRPWDLSIYACPDCGLLQFDCEPVDYYRDVIRAVGLSETMRELRRRDYRYLTEELSLSGGRFIECGCGRGEFLEVLKEFPVSIYGTEADKSNAEAAARLLNEDRGGKDQGSGEPCHIENIFPDSCDISIPGAPFDCFLSFNFLEHQPDPASMLLAMYNNLRQGGYGLITVPSFEYILEQGYYYEFIRDHIANYELGSLRRLIESCGFELIDSGRIGIGDTLRAVVRKPSGGPEKLYEQRPIKEKASEDMGCFEKIRTNKSRIEKSIEQLCERLSLEGRSLSLWGAGHQGFTIASTTRLKDYASCFVDQAPFKQGRYAPASRLPIIGPSEFLENPADAVLITAPGYIREIRADIEDLFSSQGKRAPEILDILSVI